VFASCLSYSASCWSFACPCSTPLLPAAAQSDSNENKSKDEGKREEAKEIKKDDIRKDTPGTPFKPGGLIHFDVDLALINVTVTDPYNRLVTGLEPDNFRVYEDSIEQEVVTSLPRCSYLHRCDL